MVSTAATSERAALCDLFAAVGPEAPTLCDGWNTRDLAAHLVIRERRPDAAAGVVIGRLAGHTDKVQARVADQPWDELIDRVRSGPPRWSPTRLPAVDRLANTAEFFVHHEDVRRASEPWEPRELSATLTDDLYRVLKRAGPMFARSAPAGLVLVPTDGRPSVVANKHEPSVTARGPVGELVLFLQGRQDHARVELDGEPASVEAMRSASFGI